MVDSIDGILEVLLLLLLDPPPKSSDLRVDFGEPSDSTDVRESIERGLLLDTIDAGGDEVDESVDPRRLDDELFLKPKMDLLFDFSGCRLDRN